MYEYSVNFDRFCVAVGGGGGSWGDRAGVARLGGTFAVGDYGDRSRFAGGAGGGGGDDRVMGFLGDRGIFGGRRWGAGRVDDALLRLTHPTFDV